jgi:hypothetical protein
MNKWQKKPNFERTTLSEETMLKCRELLAELLRLPLGSSMRSDAMNMTAMEVRLGCAAILGAAVKAQACPEKAFGALMIYLRQATDEEITALKETL